MTPEQLKASILQSAIQGKLVPQNPDDEPASVLLERIKTEKEELIKAGKIKKEKPLAPISEDEIPFEIPENWEWCRLSFANDMYTGNSINEAEKKTKYTGLSEGRYYIGTKDVGFDHTIVYDNGVKIPFDAEKFRVAPRNSILMCIEGGSAGRKIAFTNQEVCFGNKLCCFISFGIEYRFLYFYMQSSLFQDAFKNNTTGIIGGVSVNTLKNMLFPVPPLEEQQRIVEKIEQLLPYVDRYAKAYEKLEQFNAKFPEDMKKSILQYAIQGKLVEQRAEEGTAEELFQQIQAEKQQLIKDKKIKKEKPLAPISEDEIPFDIPESWMWVKLLNISTKITDGEHKTPRRVSSFCGYYLLSARNIINGLIKLDDVDYVDEEEYNNISKRCNPKRDDILISCSGSVGRCCVVEDDNHYVMVRSAAMVSLIDVNPKWTMYCLQSTELQKQISNKAKATAQANLFQDPIKNLIIPLPPLAEQKRIVEKIEELMPICERLKK